MSKDPVPPAGLVILPGMTYHKLPATEETLEFWGELVDKTDTDNGEAERWTELQYWFMLDTDASHDDSLPEENPRRGMYGKRIRLVYTIGHSLVYHAYPEGCTRGQKVKGADFPHRTTERLADLLFCEQCDPEEWSENPEKDFRLETARYSYTACWTPEAAVTALSRCETCWDKPHENGTCHRNGCGCGDYKGILTVPGRILIEQVKDRDPPLAGAVSRTKRF